MVKKTKNGWNLQELQETLVKDTEQRIEHGFEEIKKEQSGGGDSPLTGDGHTGDSPSVTSATSQQGQSPSVQAKPQEPTKGVQTYIPMSMYRRLNDLKLSRGETIGNLVIQAIDLWLDVQEGTKKVATTI